VNIADQCEILVRGFARVGIIALVDEATGYQKDRARDDLAKIPHTTRRCYYHSNSKRMTVKVYG